MAVSQAAKEAKWLRMLLRDLGYAQNGPTTIFEDNQGCMALAKNPEFHARTKHIDILHHFIREALEDKEVVLEYCRTEEMVADALTKAISRDKFIKLREMMGLDTQQMFH